MLWWFGRLMCILLACQFDSVSRSFLLCYFPMKPTYSQTEKLKHFLRNNRLSDLVLSGFPKWWSQSIMWLCYCRMFWEFLWMKCTDKQHDKMYFSGAVLQHRFFFLITLICVWDVFITKTCNGWEQTFRRITSHAYCSGICSRMIL